MTCGICRTIVREGLDEQQTNEELKAMYLGIGQKRVGAPLITRHFNIKILETILKNKCREKNIAMPTVNVSDLYETIKKVIASQSVPEEDYSVMFRVLSECGLDINDVHSRFRNRTTMWMHIKGCLNLEIKKLSTEEFLDKLEGSVNLSKQILGQVFRRAASRGIGGEGTDFHPTILAVCKNCQRTYPIEEFLKKDFKCDCVKEKEEAI